MSRDILNTKRWDVYRIEALEKPCMVCVIVKTVAQEEMFKKYRILAVRLPPGREFVLFLYFQHV